MTPQFILASGSSRRRELLDQIGWRYEIMAAEIDESPGPGESPVDYVCRMASGKARRAAEMQRSKLPILAADTVVVVDGEILGKPATAQQAGQMLQRLSGRTHDVLTAVVLLVPGGDESLRLNESQVTFARLDAGWITAYCAGGEPLDKAGGYAIQGGAAQFISKLEGSYSGVMGLPLFETAGLLYGAGIRPCPGNQRT